MCIADFSRVESEPECCDARFYSKDTRLPLVSSQTRWGTLNTARRKTTNIGEMIGWAHFLSKSHGSDYLHARKGQWTSPLVLTGLPLMTDETRLSHSASRSVARTEMRTPDSCRSTLELTNLGPLLKAEWCNFEHNRICQLQHAPKRRSVESMLWSDRYISRRVQEPESRPVYGELCTLCHTVIKV